jgi:phage terminase small subunit
MEWKRVVDILEPYGLLKATDYGILLGYCQLFVGLTVTEPDKIKPSHYTQFRGYCNDLGLTPVARSKVRLGDGKNKDGESNPYSGF